MAHLITGVDIGSFSIKFVCIEAGFRRSKVKQTFEEPVPAGDQPIAERQMAAVRAGLQRIDGESSFFTALSGDRISIRLLEMPFLDARKVDQVVPYELEGQIVQPLEEVVFSHVILDVPLEGSPVLAAAARTEDVGGLLEHLGDAGVTPRAVYAAPVVFRARTGGTDVDAAKAIDATDDAVTPVIAVITPDGGRKTDRDLRLLIDLGHSRTNVVLLAEGVPVFARTLMRGGRQLTEAIAASFKVTPERAEEAKCNRATVAHEGFQPAEPIEAGLGRVLREALDPLARDIRQTLASFRGRFGLVPGGFSLVGGGSQLRGLSEMLAEETGLHALPFEPARGNVEGADEFDVVAGPQFAQAEAIAWAGVLGSKQIDLRRGPFVYRASFSVLRQKAVHLGVLAALVFVCVVFDGAMAHSRLHQQKVRLESELEEATTELFGSPDKNAQKVARLLKQGFREEMPPVPRATAYDVMNELSRRLPKVDAIKLDVLELDIRPKKTFVKGIIDSVTSVDKVVDSLKEFDCIEEVSKGAITEVSGGDKQFTLTMKTKCP